MFNVTRIVSHIFRAILVLASMGLGCAHSKETVKVMTSFGKEVTAVYKEQFEAKYPNLTLEFISSPATGAVSHIESLGPATRPDILWSSSPEVFDTLSRLNLLSKAGLIDTPMIPSKVRNVNLNDPNGFFRGQALSGYGIMWNTRYIGGKNLPVPTDWWDLAKPVYFGHIIMSSPTRSGTTHLIVETILQAYGWTDGWRQLLQIGGNCGEITERSLDVPEAVKHGRFGVGLVIDFLALSSKYTGSPVEFVYPPKTTVLPASIALLKGAMNPAGAKQFMAFTLSQEGQSLLFTPEISRMPVLTTVYFSVKIPADFPNLFDVIRKSAMVYDRSVSEQRYSIVNSLFDRLITAHHTELKRATKSILDAEYRLSKRPNAKAAQLVAKARALLFSVPISEAQISDPIFLKEMNSGRAVPGGQSKLSEIEKQLDQEAKENYAKALELVQSALKIMQ